MLVFLFRLDGLCLRIDSNLFPQAQVFATVGRRRSLVTCGCLFWQREKL